MPLNVLKNRIPECKIKDETELEKQQKIPVKDYSPSPCSYRHEDARLRSSFQRKSMAMVMEKSPRKVYYNHMLTRKVPGVGRYDVAKSMDKVYKPARKY